jgi:hypothetical protein
VIGLPPSFAGGAKSTDTEVTPPTATPITGAFGRRAGTKAFELADGTLVPSAVFAVTEHV